MRFTSRANVNHSWTSQVAPCQPLHGWRHSSCEHDRLKGAKKQNTETENTNTQWEHLAPTQRSGVCKRLTDKHTCLYLCFPDSKFIIIFSGSSASSVSGFWLVTGMYSRIFWTSGSKPMSIIRSASSRTTYVQRPRTRYRFSSTSIRRPGVAITIC